MALLIGQGEVPDLVTDRPDATESALTVPVNSLQIESGFLFDKDKSGSVDDEAIDFFNTLFRYSFMKDIELRLGAILRQQTTEVGTDRVYSSPRLAPLSLGFKYHFTEENGFWPEAGIIGTFSLPLGAEAYKPIQVEPGFTFAFANELSDRFDLGYNVGINWPGDNLQYHFNYTVALSYSISDKIGIYGEFLAKRPRVKRRPIPLTGE